MAGADRMTVEEGVRKVLLDEHADVIREAARAVAAEMMEIELQIPVGALGGVDAGVRAGGGVRPRAAARGRPRAHARRGRRRRARPGARRVTARSSGGARASLNGAHRGRARRWRQRPSGSARGRVSDVGRAYRRQRLTGRSVQVVSDKIRQGSYFRAFGGLRRLDAAGRPVGREPRAAGLRERGQPDLRRPDYPNCVSAQLCLMSIWTPALWCSSARSGTTRCSRCSRCPVASSSPEANGSPPPASPAW
jgi:hypothetical protein